MHGTVHSSQLQPLAISRKVVFFYKTAESDFVPLGWIEVAKISGQKCGYAEGFDANLKPKNIERYELAYKQPQTIEACYVPPER